MDVSMLDMAGQAAISMADPVRFLFLIVGVLVGLILGVIPGLSGLIGLSLLLPFTYSMEPLAGIAMLIGLMSVTTTSDTIPAVLFGVPGTVGSAATTLDGHPLARKGQASRAFGAAFFASMIGGLIGALLLALSIPLLRPVMLAIGTPDLLAFCVFGLSLVAVLSGSNALKGVGAACIGLLFSMIGEDAQAGELRWTFNTIYLWDGMQIVPLALGLFALPELADLMIRRSTIVASEYRGTQSTQKDGIWDVLRNKFLVFRCASIGSLLGAVPGIGAAVIDWIAYGHAAKTIKGAGETFGTGDIRGVIASESSNNAKEGGSLVPTIAFGVPGSASMALLLGAFTVHGIIPGPRMLAENLDITYALVWSVAIANIAGAGICFVFAKQLARLALLRASILVPVVLAISFIGAFQGQKAWGDLYLLVGAGILGFVMKRLGWPRPPVILGFVLGALLEQYMFVSTLRYGADWLFRPIVIIVFLLSLYGVFAPSIRRIFAARKRGTRTKIKWGLHMDHSKADLFFTLGLLTVCLLALATSSEWAYGARLFPQIIAITGIVATVLLLVSMTIVRAQRAEAIETTHVDLIEDFDGLDRQKVIARAFSFLGWCIGYLVLALVIGMLPAMGIFLFAYLRFAGGEKMSLALTVAAGATVCSYLIFHTLLVVPWPDAFVGEYLPQFRSMRATRLF